MPTDSHGGTALQSRADPAISVRAVGKRYDIFERNFDRLRSWLGGGNGKHARPFWALRDASFDVNRGDAVGIVGRNGSGKSTLMQIIAGTLAPTTGEAVIRGRISALLELGSGFNPVFTGRENVFLAGSILGVPRREIEERFDEIAEFADIGDFMDQPVEVYSSGMHARLAFASAICVRPDILIVDEILSVGDAGFQQKCIGRMKKMLDSGVTLLFVSHSADMVKSLCNKGLFLQRGEQKFFGPAAEAVDLYMQSLRNETTERAQENVASRRPELATDAPEIASDGGLGMGGIGGYGTGHAVIWGVRLLDELGREAKVFQIGERINIEVTMKAATDVNRLDLVFTVRDKAGVDIFGSTCRDEGAVMKELGAGEQSTARISFTNTLAPGPHGVSLTLVRRPDHKGEGVITLEHLDAAAAFESIAGEGRGGMREVVRGKVKMPMRVEYTVQERVQAVNFQK